jgi:four helix bundle suffix protein
MVQAARSGVQNIAEGSQASGTSKKMEMKLTNVARASLEELRLDYEDFLRQRGLRVWPPDHESLIRFKAKRCSTVDEVVAWVEEERKGARKKKDRPTGTGEEHRRTRTDTTRKLNADDAASAFVGDDPSSSVPVGEGPWWSVSSSELVANAVLSLLNLCSYLLDRQIAAQAKAFEKEGGFTERLYRTRINRRRGD